MTMGRGDGYDVDRLTDQFADLASTEMTKALLAKSNETVGGLVFVLQEATVLAIRSGRERLDLKLIEAVDTATLASFDNKNKLDI